MEDMRAPPAGSHFPLMEFGKTANQQWATASTESMPQRRCTPAIVPRRLFAEHMSATGGEATEMETDTETETGAEAGVTVTRADEAKVLVGQVKVDVPPQITTPTPHLLPPAPTPHLGPRILLAPKN